MDIDFWSILRDVNNVFGPISKAIFSIERNVIDDQCSAYKQIFDAFDESKIGVFSSDFEDDIKNYMNAVI